ncbi:MAG: hypothetical protein ABID87_06970, partial [Chloroflexota bacterium]
SGLRIPGGTAPFLILLPLAVLVIWGVYFQVARIMTGIPLPDQARNVETRLLPYFILAVVAFTGIALVLMIITGPYTHFSLLP